ncbi:MAG: SUMF1/EgtB/PvdO family nonheme iron enzyme, partial [Candidatus Saganbacteria bacterium]|nr:SUMF1/EgtB/PvdO family nonheme iron enzyme [Candidatus Saganbacteria bacterium]
VWEWVGDWYNSGGYSLTDTNNPTGPDSGSGKVLRGGSWYNDIPGVFRSAYRNVDRLEDRGDSIGFRVAEGKK